MSVSLHFTPEANDARTYVTLALDRLKEKYPTWITWDDLLAWTLPSHQRAANDQRVIIMKKFLGMNPKASYDPSADSWRFKPDYPISNADELLKYLQAQETSMGLEVNKLKEAWPGCEAEIVRLESEHRLLVTRNKKDDHPKHVWADDPTLHAPLDREFVDIWNKIPVPDKHEDVIKELGKMGHKSTGEVAKDDTGVRVEKKKKKVRRGVKVTNTHMQGVFRDYSNYRPQGAK